MISIKDAEEILKHEYHTDNFEYIAKDVLLPDFKKDIHNVQFNNNLFASVTWLGESKQCDLVVLEVALIKGVENRRVAITQEMFKILKQHKANNALVAFYNADKKNYRISLLTSKFEYDGYKIVKVVSNPRRYSYALGFGTKTKTAYKFLINKGKVNSIEELTSRFSVEVVNKEFYSQIAACFTSLVGGDREGKKYTRLLNLHGVTDNNKYAEFAVRLIGRIMFCWFLKEKKSEQGIALVPNKMLSLISLEEDSSYYHNVLEPLFFELLNTNQNRRRDNFGKLDIYNQIPYLNGGLFSPHSDDLYKYTSMTESGMYGIVNIPNSWFADFYNVLSQYNFTVDENTSYDIELSIDPEMLGRIFENLLAEINPETGENAKKSTGSFYTPRDIVDYMVDSSILEYLKEKTAISEDKLKSLISYGKEDDEFAILDSKDKKAIINALYSVTVLDPACGSGAFPIGMLQKIVYVLQEIDPEANLWFDKATENIGILLKKEFEKKFNAGSLNYIRKLSVIQNSIFGVDIQPIAVEIARLRCFLSLVIEEKVCDTEPNRGINPLPNLDFKFVIANTLIELEDSAQSSMFENQEHIKELKNVRDEFFSVDDAARKAELKLEFAHVQKKMFQETISMYNKIATSKYKALSDWAPFENKATAWFDPEWMFGIKDGFNIVIGNPPYGAKLSKDEKNLYKKIFSDVHMRTPDTFLYFISKGLKLCKSSGVLSYISPNNLLFQNENEKARNLLLNIYSLISVINLGDNAFECAAVPTCIIIDKKLNTKEDYSFIYNDFRSIQLSNINWGESKNIYCKSSINNTPNLVFGVSSISTLLYNKLIEQSNSIDMIATEVASGISTGGDKIFRVDSENEFEKELLFPVLTGRELHKFCYQNNAYKIMYIERTTDIFKYPNIFSYITSFKNMLCKRSEVKAGILPWYALNRQRYKLLFSENKILLRQTSDKIIAAFDDKGYYALDSLLILKLKDDSIDNYLFVVGLLNSKLNNYIYKSLTQETGRAFAQVKPINVRKLLIPKDCKNKFQIVNIVQQIQNYKCSESTIKIVDLEHQIDQLVYELYGLTEEEIAIVEGNEK